MTNDDELMMNKKKILIEKNHNILSVFEFVLPKISTV